MQKLDTAEGQLEEKFLERVGTFDVGGAGLVRSYVERGFAIVLCYSRPRGFERLGEYRIEIGRRLDRKDSSQAHPDTDLIHSCTATVLMYTAIVLMYP